jgi:prepilin-type processing-associated H-X9-DG protein
LKNDHTKTLDIKACIYPGEKSRYWLAIITVIPITLAYIFFAINLTFGVGLLVVPFIFFWAWFTVRIFRAHLLGNCVAVSDDNFPEILKLLNQVCIRLDYLKPVEVYVYQEGNVNAFLIRRFRTRIILLPHALVTKMIEPEDKTQLLWTIARCVGHLKAKHLRFTWLNILIESFEKIFVLNILLYPWERATQYSGDRIGLAVCNDLHAALSAIKKAMIGNELAERATLLGALQQRYRLSGSLFAWLAEISSSHPHLTKRIASLIDWAKDHDIELYDSFMRDRPDRGQLEQLLNLSISKLYQLKLAITILFAFFVFIGVPLAYMLSLSRSMESATRVQCTANLMVISTTILIYALDNETRYPTNLQLLIDQGKVTQEQLLCPSSDAIYQYIAGQGELGDIRNVLIYEEPEYHGGKGGNVVFLDGHVEFLSPEKIQQLVTETRHRIELEQGQ